MSEDFDPFCRIYIGSSLSIDELTDMISASFNVHAANHMITTKHLDIAVDINDQYDEAKSSHGENRWLYFPYSLEIDPVYGEFNKEYVAELISLLNYLWGKGLNAVAAAEFEELLPSDPRRKQWDSMVR